MSSEVDIKNSRKANRNVATSNPGNSTGSPERIRRQRSADRATCDYAELPADVLHRVLCAITARGCAVQFGYTRDGGAFAIRIVGDGEPYTEFIKPTEDVNAALVYLAEDFEV